MDFFNRSLNSGLGIVFLYTKLSGETSYREGVVMSIRESSVGLRVWVLDGEGYTKQYVPALMHDVAMAAWCWHCCSQPTKRMECCGVAICDDCVEIDENGISWHEGAAGFFHLRNDGGYEEAFAKRYYPSALHCPEWS